MKKFLAKCLFIALCLFALSATAFSRPVDPPNDAPGQLKKQLPEPGTLALLGAGIAGIGGYLYIKRKNKK
jgi:hypothetical protein